MSPLRLAAIAAAVVLWTGVAASGADEGTAGSGGTVVLELRDGSRLVGRVVDEGAGRLRIRTLDGIEVEVPFASMTSRRPLTEASARPQRRDPNGSRLMFAPTGRPLPRGEGYLAVYELVFPGVAYGLTDHFALAGGVSMVPGLGLGEQFAYVAPRVGTALSDRLAISAAALLAAGGQDGDSAGAVLGVATFGPPARSLSAGFGLVRELGEPGARTRALIMMGGQVELTRSLALVSENWLLLGEGFELDEQPLGLALRFGGERISADLGVILVPEYLDEGFPIPWLSFSYRFGRSPDGAAAFRPTAPIARRSQAAPAP